MIDLYRLPSDCPGFDESRRIVDPLARARFLEAELAADLDERRFLPYIQVHEFEALLFSDPSAFAIAFPDATAEIQELVKIAESVASPEHVDDGESTSPANRIAALSQPSPRRSMLRWSPLTSGFRDCGKRASTSTSGTAAF